MHPDIMTSSGTISTYTPLANIYITEYLGVVKGQDGHEFLLYKSGGGAVRSWDLACCAVLVR